MSVFTILQAFIRVLRQVRNFVVISGIKESLRDDGRSVLTRQCKDKSKDGIKLETYSYKGDKFHMTGFYINKVLKEEVELFEWHSYALNKGTGIDQTKTMSQRTLVIYFLDYLLQVGNTKSYSS